MKILNKSFLRLGLFACALSTTMTGCMDEALPSSALVTEEQVQESPTAAKSLCLAMPANFNFASFFESWMDDGLHCIFGYGSMMMIRDFMSGDMCENIPNYSHWSAWTYNKNQGQDYIYSQYFWNYHHKFLLAVNTTIDAVDPQNATPDQLGYLGAGLAFRALLYLDMGRMYEFLPNDKTSNINADGNDVLGLTVPIVKNGMAPEDAANNPRATHAQLAQFIEEDLNAAEQYIIYNKDRANNTLPDLACVYGLKARLYMWNEDYANAALYARKAIDASAVQPIPRNRYLDTKNGFNQASDFMWASSTTSEDLVVKTGIINWTSWMSNQTTYGYTSKETGKYMTMDAKMYQRVSDTDFRKLLFKAPEGSPLRGKEPFLIPAMSTDNNVPACASIKFRPNQGETSTYSIGSAVSYPVMRVEEMFFIEAEAVAHTDSLKGVQLVESFMKAHRDPSYTCKTKDLIDEIVFQKRVELWGEGQTFFDIKRLNMSVTRGYPGTNHISQARLNSVGRPAWMNLVIVVTEKNNNKALEGMNNPDPSDLYTPWVE